MSNTIRIKRRTTGTAGAPEQTLATGELAYNEIDDVLYIGKYNNNSPINVAIGGRGDYVREVTGTSPIVASAGKTPAISLASGYGDTQNPYASKTANYVLASPNGSSGTPSFRALVAADIPSLTASKISDFQTTVLAYRLDQFAAPTASVAFNNQKITGLGTPTLDGDAATKAYVDAMSSGVHAHPAARVATTANLTTTYNNASGTLTATSNGAISIDSVSLSANDRVLVKDQTSKVQNGIYVVTTVGNGSTPFLLTRATDMNEAAEFPSSFVFVSEGNTQADNGYVCTTNSPVTIGTTDIEFTQFSGAGQITAGDGMTKTGNTLNVASTGGGSLTIGVDSINLSQIGTAGTYKSVTVDAYGRVTAGTNPTTLSGYGITDALSASTTSTQDGYFGNINLYDDSTPSHYLQITNSANLTSARILSVNVNDADRTISLSGNLTVSSAATVSGTNTGDQTITLTGDVTGTGTGSFATTLANSGVVAGTYNDSATAVRPFTVDAKGRITSIGTAVTIAPAFSSISSKPTTLSGYGITDAQPLDATLTALAGVTTTSNTLIYATGSDTFTTTTLTSFARGLLDDTDNTAARSTLGLGSIATQESNNVSITGGSITNLTTFDGNTIDGGTF